MRIFILLFLLQTLNLQVFAQNEWELKKEGEGIKVYTRNVEGSDYNEFKAVAVMEGKVSAFVSVLKDVEVFPAIFGNTKEAELLKSTDNSQIHYLLFGAPWPVSNRDAIYTFNFTFDSISRAVRIDVNTNNDYIPDKGFERIVMSKGSWLFKPFDNNKVEVTLQMHTSPGGNIPAWLVNSTIVDSPYGDFVRLKEFVKMEKYQK